jgi:hypothetical protein
MTSTELMLMAQAIMGYVWQWTRGLKKVPNWVSWTIFGLSAMLLYVFATPGFEETFAKSWRTALAGMISFLLAARGAASSSSDATVAPKTNSL